MNQQTQNSGTPIQPFDQFMNQIQELQDYVQQNSPNEGMLLDSIQSFHHWCSLNSQNKAVLSLIGSSRTTTTGTATAGSVG